MSPAFAIFCILWISLIIWLCRPRSKRKKLRSEGRAGTEELRDDLHRIITNYGSLTFVETVGVLRLVEMDLAEQLRDCDHPSAQK